MRYFLLLGATLMTLTGCIGAGTNSSVTFTKDGYLPQMTGIDLLGADRKIPDSLKGDLNIVTFAFERQQQEEVNTWIAEIEPIIESNPDVRFYELPLIYEMNAMSRTWVNNGMRSGIPSEEARERTITVYTEREKFLDKMDMTTANIYTLLVQKDGEILWRTQGVASDEKIQDLKNAIRSNL